ncbi:amt family ammonium transporter [Kwoniella heveanensis CBS 569]|uniref:Ammonium transporter n=1 Tax=Kwoniella heveanensis BCC8398 TaxID=1296120 RepID=A0A1B9GIH9_9TREE|nr:amt family ammonium transporter [Kwoniella heveanensis BCC8398]OCF45756.1 amt family ammonium transporter [Kwoniella heveanensis CBS 569]
MVNVTYTETSQDVVYYAEGSEEAVIYNLGDMAWVLASMALVWLMIPGVGLFYSGLLRRKNALSMIFLSVAAVAVGSFQWFFWGYSLAFSDTGSKFIGDLRYFCLKGVLADPSAGSSRIPALLFCVYQCMFCLITGMLAIGGFAERSKIGPVLVFLFCWLTLVYCPIANWTWNPNGWSFIMGGLDFAGGTPVHISSGTASLAIALYLGKRRGYGTERLAYKPHNTAFVILGTVFLWFGWFGFNGGSALSANLRAVQACIVTNLAASVGGITWMLLDWRLERKYSAVGFCSGAISGLVGITPAAGFVGAPAAVAIGFVTAVACNFATQLKFLIRVDETLDVFASHAIGGMVGNVLTGLFAQASVAAFDGITEIPGGWFDRNWVQLGYQIADLTAGFAYSFVMTSIICWIMHFIPGLRLRADEEAEIVGIDDAYLGEFAYDYVGTDPELRLHRIESKPHITSGDVIADSPHSPAHTEAESNEKIPHGAQGNAAVGGGRVDV